MKTMNPEELLDFLGGEFSDDYWSDSACLLAESALEAFSSADWDELERRVPRDGKSMPLFLGKLTSILAHGEPGRAIPMLLLLALHEDKEVSYEAFESLRGFPVEIVGARLTAEHRERLIHLADTASPLEQIALGESLRRYGKV